MTTVIIVSLIIVIVSFKIIGGIIRFCDRNVGFLLVLKWLAGHHHRPRTDATFFHPGTKVIHPSGRASRRHFKPGYYRMGIRWAYISVIGSSVYGYFTERTLTEICWILALVALVLYGQHRGLKAAKLRGHRRSTVNPLRIAVAEQLGYSEKAITDSLSIRPDYVSAAGGEHVGTLVLPDNWQNAPGQQTAMETLVNSRLGIPLSYSWRTAKHPMTLEFRRTPTPPSLVALASVLDEIRSLDPNTVLMGKNGKGESRYWDLKAEDPGAGIAAPSRRGKTSIILNVASQALYHGAERILILDPKMTGVDECLAGIPGVEIWNNTQDIEGAWKALARFHQFLDDRIQAYANDRTLEFPRAMLIIDEISMFAARSKAHWRDIKERNDPATPPAMADVAACLWMGAAYSVNTLLVGQRLDYGITGGLMESLGIKMIAGHNQRSWQRTIGTTPIPPATKARGRFYYYDGGGQPEEIQCVYGSFQEFRELALSGSAEHKPGTPSEESLKATLSTKLPMKIIKIDNTGNAA